MTIEARNTTFAASIQNISADNLYSLLWAWICLADHSNEVTEPDHVRFALQTAVVWC